MSPEVEENQETWNKKKIFIAACIALAVGGLAYQNKSFILGQEHKLAKKSFTTSPGKVAGAKTDEEDVKEEKKIPSFSVSSLDIQANIQATAQEKIEEIKKQVTSLSVEDVASSSPQLQKVINDIKALEQYPKTQAKEMCENICKSL